MPWMNVAVAVVAVFGDRKSHRPIRSVAGQNLSFGHSPAIAVVVAPPEVALQLLGLFPENEITTV